MSDAVNRAAAITPPVSGLNTIVLASTIAAGGQKVKLPSDWRGFLTVQAQGADVFFAIGDKDVTVDETAVSTVDVGTHEVTAHAAGECQWIPSGSSASVDLGTLDITPGSDVFVAHKESAAGAKVRLIASSGHRPIA